MINTQTHCTTRVWVTISTQELKLENVFTDFTTSESIAMRLIYHLSFIIYHSDKRQFVALAKDLGQLVVLGFDVTVFTPAPYQRHRL